MKRTILYLLLTLFTIPIMAQTSRTRTFNQRLFDAKVEQIAQSLNLSQEKKSRFIPIYREYSEEMIKVWNETMASSKDEMEQVKHNIRRQERSQAVRLKYTDRFATVLTASEIQQFYKVENEIQRRLKARRNRSNHH